MTLKLACWVLGCLPKGPSTRIASSLGTWMLEVREMLEKNPCGAKQLDRAPSGLGRCGYPRVQVNNNLGGCEVRGT